MAPPGIYFYEYDSRLPFMWNLAQGETESKSDGRGMTFEQANLWGSVKKTRDRVLTDERYRDSDQAIQQYILEYWVWGKHWPGQPFPGSFPTKTRLPHGVPGPSYFGVLEITDAPPPFATANHRPAMPHPIDEKSQQDEIRAAILRYKGLSYVPFHGWDEATGLPRYAIVCTAVNGFRAFCGKGQEYFKEIRNYFRPVARVMFQRVQHSLLVVWIEAPTLEHILLLNANENAWDNFKGCWAFFKSWAEMYKDNTAEDTVQFLRDWQGKGELDVSGVELERPPMLQLVLGGGQGVAQTDSMVW